MGGRKQLQNIVLRPHVNFSLLIPHYSTSAVKCAPTFSLCFWFVWLVLFVWNPECIARSITSSPWLLTHPQERLFANRPRPMFSRGLETTCLLWFRVCGCVQVVQNTVVWTKRRNVNIPEEIKAYIWLSWSWTLFLCQGSLFFSDCECTVLSCSFQPQSNGAWKLCIAVWSS